ncbi:MAG: hypothetical protein LBH04_06315 [Tannerellaceae bacterium]|jgi:hypothetical protein|nr:hypothetical protein [Tannerellaceae bacterium]
MFVDIKVDQQTIKIMKAMMKNWYLIIVIFLFISCNSNEKEEDSKEINIEHSYPYLYEKHSIDDIDVNKLELFNKKIYLINSIAQLNEIPLFVYSSGALMEELSKCDFNKYTLIITSSSTLNEVVELKYNFYYNHVYSEYVYYQTCYSKPLEQPAKNIYFIMNAFSVKKIPELSKALFSKLLFII